MPDAERIDFVRAVECLMDAESVYTGLDGAKSRFDDFGVLHYKLLRRVHLSASFLLFHRLFLWSYEEALRSECGYKGTLPYWNWGEDAHAVEESPLFDGSPTSLGSNGEYEETEGLFGMPPGSGGGCLIEGPFSNRTVNLGPGADNTFAYNPRCIRRDLNSHIASKWASLRNSTDVILDSPNIELFQALVQGDERWPEAVPLGISVHGGGHFMSGMRSDFANY
jgi:tyrosinase